MTVHRAHRHKVYARPRRPRRGSHGPRCRGTRCGSRRACRRARHNPAAPRSRRRPAAQYWAARSPASATVGRVCAASPRRTEFARAAVCGTRRRARGSADSRARLPQGLRSAGAATRPLPSSSGRCNRVRRSRSPRRLLPRTRASRRIPRAPSQALRRRPSRRDRSRRLRGTPRRPSPPRAPCAASPLASASAHGRSTPSSPWS